MAPWTSLFVPLDKGLDLSKEATLGGPQLAAAVNVDFGTEGRIQGRPSRAAAQNFSVLTSASTPAYNSSVTFANTGFSPQGLLSLHDGRPALATQGRIFANDGSVWRDLGHFASTRVDRLFTSRLTSTGASISRTPIAPDFGESVDSTGDYMALYDADGKFQAYSTGLSAGVADYAGGSARCGSYTAVLTYEHNNLHLITRTGTTVTAYTIATDAAAISDDGDAPSICCDHSSTVFFVAYRTTTANQYKVLRVTTAGSVTHTFTGSATATLQGIWIANGPSTLVVALGTVSVAASNGQVAFKVLSNAALADQSLDSTYTTAAFYTGPSGADTYAKVRAVTVGVESATRAWWAIELQSPTYSIIDVAIGTVNPGSASSAALVTTYHSGAAAEATTGALAHVSIAHQPIKVQGRMYLTLITANTRPLSTNLPDGTWVTLDLSNLASVGPFARPTLAARGNTSGTAINWYYSGGTTLMGAQPEAAVLTSDSLGWTFPTYDFVAFDVDTTGEPRGARLQAGVNRVTFSGPRAATIPSGTLISGSVPHLVCGEQTYEAGFVGEPAVNITQDLTVGGAVPVGQYSVTAVWRYTDATGRVWRSAPATADTVTLSGGAYQTVGVAVTCPLFSERPAGDVVIEVYMTDTDPTTDSAHYLQTVLVPTAGVGVMYTTLTSATVITTSESLYTDASEYIHSSVRGDGGVTTVGRRVWMAGDRTAYASLLQVPGKGVSWNEEGALSVDVPAAAGRIIALEGMGDKVVLFCERGIYVTQDGGPDNTGIGADLAYPLRVSDLKVSGPRSTALTDKGVAFVTALNTTDNQKGGPWMLDGSLVPQYLGRAVVDYMDVAGDIDVVYSAERQQLYVVTYTVVTSLDGGGGVVVFDFRTSQMAVWDHRQSAWGDLLYLTTVDGVLWTMADGPAPFSGAPGSDTGDGAYTMMVRTSDFAADGRDGLGWSRVRGVSVLGVKTAGAHTLTVRATQDGFRASNNGGLSLAAGSTDTTWPSSRHHPEWRLPSQKCSTLSVQLEASPATAQWAAIRLDVQPLPGRAPAKNRS